MGTFFLRTGATRFFNVFWKRFFYVFWYVFCTFSGPFPIPVAVVGSVPPSLPALPSLPVQSYPSPQSLSWASRNVFFTFSDSFQYVFCYMILPRLGLGLCRAAHPTHPLLPKSGPGQSPPFGGRFQTVFWNVFF